MVLVSRSQTIEQCALSLLQMLLYSEFSRYSRETRLLIEEIQWLVRRYKIIDAQDCSIPLQHAWKLSETLESSENDDVRTQCARRRTCNKKTFVEDLCGDFRPIQKDGDFLYKLSRCLRDTERHLWLYRLRLACLQCISVYVSTWIVCCWFGSLIFLSRRTGSARALYNSVSVPRSRVYVGAPVTAWLMLVVVVLFRFCLRCFLSCWTFPLQYHVSHYSVIYN